MNYKKAQDLKVQQELTHFGVLGMHWGVTKGSPSTVISRKLKTKSGETIHITVDKNSKMSKIISKVSSGGKEFLEKNLSLTARDSNGKKVGSITVYEESKDELNVVWVSTSKSARGQGIGSALMTDTINQAKKKRY